MTHRPRGRALLQHIERYPRWLRMLTGGVLVLGGIVGFLPVVGFWMAPLGLLVLSRDVHSIRRLRRRLALRWARRRRARRHRREGNIS